MRRIQPKREPARRPPSGGFSFTDATRNLCYIWHDGGWRATESMIRTLSLLGMAALCASCRTDSSTDLIQTEPIINLAEINARDDCLHREVDRLLEPKGSSPISLQAIAISATNYCGQAIKAKLLKSSPSDGRELARDDQAKTEQRAFRIGLELRESRIR
jgi:hypothetical protein